MDISNSDEKCGEKTISFDCLPISQVYSYTIKSNRSIYSYYMKCKASQGLNAVCLQNGALFREDCDRGVYLVVAQSKDIS